MAYTKTSKFLSLILRHKPEVIEITLDEHGWARVDEVIAGIAKTRPMSMAILEEIVATDSKGRYAFNEDKTLIRANQGHSVHVDVELEEKAPPAVLYHGTGEKSVASIEAQGLLPMSRLYVHLSLDVATATKVGQRHGKPEVFRVDAQAMAAQGHRFYVSRNGVWLAKHVPAEFLQRL